MSIEIDGQVYDCVRGSDIVRDGMFLQISLGGEALIEVFYSDETNKVTVTCFAEPLPSELLEATFVASRKLLPPIVTTDNDENSN